MITVASPSRIEILRELPMFAQCSDEELSLVESLADEIEVEPGEVSAATMEEGEQSRACRAGSRGGEVRKRKDD